MESSNQNSSTQHDRRSILIHNCESSITADEINAIFACMGEIRHLKKQFNVQKNAFCWLLEYASESSAQDAIEALQNYTLLGKELYITYIDETLESVAQEPAHQSEEPIKILIRELFDELIASEGFATLRCIPETHREHITAEVRDKINENDKVIEAAVEKITSFLTQSPSKAFKSQLYSDFKKIVPDSSMPALEKVLSESTRIETNFLNRNYLYFESVPASLSLEDFRSALCGICRSEKLEMHEASTNTSRQIIADLGSTECNNQVAALQVLVLGNDCFRIHVAKKKPT